MSHRRHPTFTGFARLVLATAFLAPGLAALADAPFVFGRPEYPVTGTPYTPAFADFDGDTLLDLAVVGNGYDVVSILLGNGDGTFDPQTTYAVGNAPRDLAVGDLDGDTDMDIVTADADGDTMSVLLNNGDGTFAPAVTMPVGDGPLSVELGDLDADGDLDAVTVASNDDTFSIHINDGNGGFTTSGITGSVPVSYATALGDIDGDGRIDIFVSSATANTVFLNSGGFGPAWTGLTLSQTILGAGGQAWHVRLADLDGQSGLDAVVCYGFPAHVLTVHLNNGAGLLGAGTTLIGGENPLDVTVGDCDGDGDLDIASCNFSDTHASLFLNDGEGAFGPEVEITAGRSARGIVFGDPDGDGDLDLAQTTEWGGTVAIMLNPGDGAYASYDIHETGLRAWAPTAADVNDDGRLDILQAHNETGEISVMLNEGGMSFGPLVTYPAGSNPWQVRAGDVDGDGAPDVVAADGGGTAGVVLLNDGSGGFGPPTSYPLDGLPRGVELVDLDGQNGPDMVFALYGTTHQGHVSIRFSNGDGTFGSEVIYSAVNAISLTSDDLDGDGDIDLAVGSSLSDVTILLNDGTGVFTSNGTPDAGSYHQGIDSGDVDGDGDIDIVVTTRQNIESPIQGVVVLLNNGDATFAPEVGYETFGPPYSVRVADLDGDGAADVITPLFSSSIPQIIYKLSVHMAVGDGTLGAPSIYATGATQTVDVGDFDDDGDLDLVATGQLHQVEVHPNQCDPVIPCPADIDGGGAVDVTDLLAVLAAWGACPGCPADVNDDDTVDVTDLLIVLAAWGPCS